jgi:peptide/nickel transport system substrate-binding protein
MKFLITIKWFATLISAILFTSCNGKNRGLTNKETDKDITEAVKSIIVPDAQQILPEWSKENVVVFHWRSGPDNLHPANSSGASRSLIHFYTQKYILRNDPINMDIAPDLVKSLPQISSDKLRFEYELRDEAKWDDGTPITANDIIFTYKANVCELTENPQAKAYLSHLKDIEGHASDNRRFTIVMKDIYVQNLIFVTDYPIMQQQFFDPNRVLDKYTFAQLESKSIADEAPTDLKNWAFAFNGSEYGGKVEFLAGAGPYKVDRLEQGQQIIITRKEKHWTSNVQNPSEYEKNYPEKIVFKIIKDDNAIMLELKNQNIDASTWVNTRTLVEDLEKDASFIANYNYNYLDNFDFSYLGMNMKPDGSAHKEFFVDKNVRRAMAHLVPIEQIIQTVYYSKATRYTTMFSPLKKGYNNNLKPIPHDIETAKRLLNDAGWRDTDGDNVIDKVEGGEKLQFDFELMYPAGNPVVDEIVKIMKESMYQAGIVMQPKAIELNLFGNLARKHDFDMVFGAWSASSIPDDFSQIWHTSQWVNNGSNYTGFGNVQSDALIDSLNATMDGIDDEKRIPMLKRFQEMVYDEQPYIFLYSSKRKVVIHKRFGNQFMTFERPGLVLSNLKLLSSYGAGSSAAKDTAM